MNMSVEEELAYIRCLETLLMRFIKFIEVGERGRLLDWVNEFSESFRRFRDNVLKDISDDGYSDLNNLVDSIEREIKNYYTVVSKSNSYDEAALNRIATIASRIDSMFDSFVSIIRVKKEINLVTEEIFFIKTLKTMLEDENNYLLHRISNMKKIILAKDQLIKSLNVRIRSYEEHIEKLKNASSDKINMLRNENESLKSEIKRLRESLEGNENLKILENYKLKIEKLIEENERLKKNYFKKLQSLTSERDRWMKKAMDKSVREIEVIVDDLKKEIEKLRLENKRLTLQNERLKQAISSIKHRELMKEK